MAPLTLLPGLLNEPLVVVKQGDQAYQAFPNVCTHRANLLVHHRGVVKKMQCQYHGRRFNLAGQLEFMPEFGAAEDFPRPCDHLPSLPLESWRQWLFVALEPAFDLAPVLAALEVRVGFLPLEQFRFAPELSRDYLVQAHWALYCDNYLEGFHIPFVHADLNAVLDYGAYRTELFEHGNLQVGVAAGDEACFDLPTTHPNYGERIAAFYFWIFPNLMLNFYPWGLSVNLVRPLGPKQTKVSFLLYVYDTSKLEAGAGAALDKVEREDEFVVENVQRGLGSRFYSRGRFSPTREQGVHQFHQMLSAWMA